MIICLVESKMKDSFKTRCFASIWLIEIEAREKKTEFWGEHWNKAKEKSMLFWMIMYYVSIAGRHSASWTLTSRTFADKDSALGTCSLNRWVGL